MDSAYLTPTVSLKRRMQKIQQLAERYLELELVEDSAPTGDFSPRTAILKQLNAVMQAIEAHTEEHNTNMYRAFKVKIFGEFLQASARDGRLLDVARNLTVPIVRGTEAMVLDVTESLRISAEDVLREFRVPR
ncbi:hypothetical protein MMC30_002050 [Trapelia coarctata]|nr:hypothetical protein [Trapelia coarctata]